jgi:2-polyprenyl-3-methyl-5-hydroxy-6-metoxy-1,4-benzoquinol methylase
MKRRAKVARDALVLDVGCNNGYGTVIIAQQSRMTVGVDVSPSAIESAQRHNARENIEYRVIDGLRLPFDDGFFDLVTSFQVIEHISNTARYLAEIRRVLKPGGTALLTTPNAHIRLEPGMKPWNEFHVREYTADELRELLQQTFNDVAILGLFASRPAYKANRLFRSTIKALLPHALVAKLRRSQSSPSSQKAAAQAPAQNFLGRHSTADFWYRTEGLDRSLDFLAVCK